jgi:hypothetical protein
VGHSTQRADEKYKILVGKAEGSKPFWRPRSRWKYAREMDRNEQGARV